MYSMCIRQGREVKAGTCMAVTGLNISIPVMSCGAPTSMRDGAEGMEWS